MGIAELRKRRSSANGVFGMKAHFHQLSPFLDDPAITQFIRGAKLIRMRRRDLVSQAISYYVATSTGLWSVADTTAEEANEPAFNRGQIEAALDTIRSEEAGHQMLIHDYGLSAFDVWYEDLIADPDSICKGACRCVGVECDHRFDIAQAGLKRLATARNAEWKQRFTQTHSVSANEQGNRS